MRERHMADLERLLRTSGLTHFRLTRHFSYRFQLELAADAPAP